MRRLTALAFAGLLTLSACSRSNNKLKVETVEESASQTLSVVHMADPKATLQLLRGFHDVEQNSWRWTMGRFAVSLRPPLNAARNGASLVARFAIPDAVIARTGRVAMSATVSGVALPPETYTKAGEYTYTREVPARALAGEAVTAEFSLDKFLPAGAAETRELGVVMSSIGLEPR